MTTKTHRSDQKLDELVVTFADALRDQNAAVFAGAGLSVPAGFVNWKELMRSIADDLALSVDREHDLIAVAQYHQNERGGRHRINQLLIEEFVQSAALTENHRILARLPIGTFWTTNYDDLLERALADAGKSADVKITTPNLATNRPRRDAVVYKMHGDAKQPHDAVVTKDDYEAYNTKRQLFSTALQGDLVSKTFLFLGFSFSDPNLAYILSRIRVLLHENRRDHYCLLKRVQRKDFKRRRDYEYATTKQELEISDLSRYGIIGVRLDSYDDVTAVLKRIERRYRANQIFVSGSAETYTPWKEDEARQFLHELSGELAKNGFGIVSGFGLGVGPAVINGVLDQLARSRTQTLADRLILRPFPQFTTGGKSLKDRWEEYRERIASEAGIAIFLFGNKIVGGKIVAADGVRREFEISFERGLHVLPIGATGSVARELWEEVRSNFRRYYPEHPSLKRRFTALGQMGKNWKDLIRAVVAIVTVLRRRL